MNELTKDERAELERRLVFLQTLRNHDGWKLFQVRCDLDEGAAYQAMMGAPDAHNAAKHMGSYVAIKSLKSWIDNEERSIVAMLRGVDL